MKATKLLWVLEFPLPPGSNRVKLLSQSGKKCKLMVFGLILDIFIDKLPEEKSQKDRVLTTSKTMDAYIRA